MCQQHLRASRDGKRNYGRPVGRQVRRRPRRLPRLFGFYGGDVRGEVQPQVVAGLDWQFGGKRNRFGLQVRVENENEPKLVVGFDRCLQGERRFVGMLGDDLGGTRDHSRHRFELFGGGAGQINGNCLQPAAGHIQGPSGEQKIGDERRCDDGSNRRNDQQGVQDGQDSQSHFNRKTLS